MLVSLLAIWFRDARHASDLTDELSETMRCNEVTDLIDFTTSSYVPPKQQGDASLTFEVLDIYLDGGSHGGESQCNDLASMLLYWVG